MTDHSQHNEQLTGHEVTFNEREKEALLEVHPELAEHLQVNSGPEREAALERAKEIWDIGVEDLRAKLGEGIMYEPFTDIATYITRFAQERMALATIQALLTGGGSNSASEREVIRVQQEIIMTQLQTALVAGYRYGQAGGDLGEIKAMEIDLAKDCGNERCPIHHPQDGHDVKTINPDKTGMYL